jgi:hypothetical protein
MTVRQVPADAKDFERGRTASLRACPRARSSNRDGTRSATRLEIGRQAGDKIPEAGEATQDSRERACGMDPSFYLVAFWVWVQ